MACLFTTTELYRNTGSATNNITQICYKLQHRGWNVGEQQQQQVCMSLSAIFISFYSFSLHLFVSQKNLNDEELYRQKYRKLLHFEINILNILNIFTEIIGMAPSINVQDWYGDRHTCQIASGALGHGPLEAHVPTLPLHKSVESKAAKTRF